MDVHRRNDSTESEDNCIDDPKKRSKIQKVRKSKKTKLSDKTKPSESELNETLIEDDLSHKPRGPKGLYISKKTKMQRILHPKCVQI